MFESQLCPNTVSGMFTYEPFIKHWTEDLVQINIPQKWATLHSPRRQDHNWWPKQHGSITSCNRWRTSATFLLLISSKSLNLDFSLTQFSEHKNRNNFSNFCAANQRRQHCSMHPKWRLCKYPVTNNKLICFRLTDCTCIYLWPHNDLCFSLVLSRESTALPHVEWLITCPGILQMRTGNSTFCNGNLKQLPIWPRGQRKRLSTWKILLLQLKGVPRQVTQSVWFH